jgi:hypothetical protein
VSAWKPGDVAMALVTWDNAPAFRKAKGESDVTTKPAFRSEGWWVFGPTTRIPVGDEMSARPLVVLDLPDGAKAGWPVLVDALRKAREATGFRMTFDGLIAQIEAQTTTPKPDEPQGLGAVVRERHPEDGVDWVRVPLASNDARWFCGDTGEWREWSQIDAVLVLSEGVVES